MPGLFEQFPHTNFHELNLDWMIDLLNQFKQDLEDRAVISVNGMTGEVTLYESENVVLPPLTNTSSWRLVRMMDGQYVGILFQNDHVWLQQGNSTLKLLTTEDIPTSAGVVSWNGRTGVVNVTGADIPIDNSPDPDSIRLALETEHTERVNADNALQNSIDTTNQALSTLSNKINAIATSDCNTATETGRYLTSISTQNQPSASHWIIDVIKYNENEISQVARGLYTNVMFIRAYNSGTWSAWEQLALKSDVTAKRYSVTTVTSTIVPPFGAFAQIDIPSNDRANYGRIVSATPHASSTNPATCMITWGDGGILVYSQSEATFNVDVVFCKYYIN